MAVTKKRKVKRKKVIIRPSVEIIALLKEINAKLDKLAGLDDIVSHIKRNQ